MVKDGRKIIAAIEEFGKRPDRLPLAFMLPIAEEILEALKHMHSMERFSQAGAFAA